MLVHEEFIDIENFEEKKEENGKLWKIEIEKNEVDDYWEFRKKVKLFLESVREGVERWRGACDGEVPEPTRNVMSSEEKSRKNIVRLGEFNYIRSVF